MKIAICTHRFQPPLVGGTDVYTERLRAAFCRAGHQVFILAFDASAPFKDRSITVEPDRVEGVAVARIRFALEQRPKEAFDLLYDPEMGTIARDLLVAERPDLLLVMNFYTITLAVVAAAVELGLPVVHIATDFLPVCRRATLIRWDDQPCSTGESVKNCARCFVSRKLPGRLAASALSLLPERALTRLAARNPGSARLNPLGLLSPYWKQVEVMQRRLAQLRPMLKQIGAILVPTTFTRDAFLKGGFLPEQVHLLPFGVDEQGVLAGVAHTPGDHTRFLFIGRLQPYKGVHLLLEAFNRLNPSHGATLTLYGSADGYEDYFRGLVQQMQSNPQVRYAGTVDQKDLPGVFSQADYLVLPSTWHENSPLVLLDALQSGTPVIASRMRGVTDLVKDGENGLLFPMGDVHALQAVLQRAVDQPELKDRLAGAISLPGIDAYARSLIRLGIGSQETV